jgi:hypothetical protein
MIDTEIAEAIQKNYWNMFEDNNKEKNKNMDNQIKKYYMEVIGGSKILYTVNAHSITISDCGCYRFYLNDELVASYPINRTIIKSIEDKQTT